MTCNRPRLIGALSFGSPSQPSRVPDHSVAIYPVISTEQDLREQLENGDFLDLVFEEESICAEELPTEGHVSADLHSCYEQFADDLPDVTRNSFEHFADLVCWDYRDVPQPLESSFQPEDIHFSCSPGTCDRLAKAVASLDRAAIDSAFIDDSAFETSAQSIAYLDAWGILSDARRNPGSSFSRSCHESAKLIHALIAIQAL